MENNNTALKKRSCKACGKTLKMIGVQRSNGSCNYSDFASRSMHKKCFKSIKETSNVLKMIEQIENKIKKHNELVTEINTLENSLFESNQELNELMKDQS